MAGKVVRDQLLLVGVLIARKHALYDGKCLELPKTQRRNLSA